MNQRFSTQGRKKIPNQSSKNVKKNRLRDHWEYMRHNILVIGVPEEEREQGIEKLFEVIISFPNLVKAINI